MKKGIVCILSVSMLSGLLAAGCSGKAAGEKENSVSNGKIELSVYCTVTEEDPRAEGVYSMIEEFESENPDCVVKVESNAHSDYQTKLNAMVSAKNLPDVFETRDDWNYDFVASGSLSPLNDMVENNKEWSDKFLDIWEEQTFEGQIYGIPAQFITNEAVYVNERILSELGYDEFPTVWEDMIPLLEKAKAEGYIPMVLGAKEGWPIWSHLGEPLTQYMCGEEWVKQVGGFHSEMTYENPEFISVLTFMNDLQENGYLNSDFVSVTDQEALEYYYNEEALCFLSGSWLAASLRDMAPEEVYEVTKPVPLPRPKDAKEEVEYGMFTGGSGWAWSIASHVEEEKREYAEKLIMKLTGDEAAKIDFGIGRMAPLSIEKVEGIEDVDLTPTLQQFMELVANAPSIYRMNQQQNGSVMNDVIYKSCQQMFTDTMEPEDVAAAIQQKYLEVAITREK